MNNGFKSYKAVKKPYLNSSHKQKRLEFCNLYKDKSMDFWNSVLFSDETRIQLCLSDKSPMVRRPKNTSLNKEYLKPTQKFPVSIMIWACFCKQGTGELKIIDSNLRS